MTFEFRPNPNFKADVVKAAIEALQKIKCPIHGTAVTVVSEDPLKWECCCAELQAKITATARSSN